MPSGASIGTRKAVELRDGDPARYGGQGVNHVNGEIAETLTGRTYAELREVDTATSELNDTDTKSRLAANAVIGVSLAATRAGPCRAGRTCGSRSPRQPALNLSCRWRTSRRQRRRPRRRRPRFPLDTDLIQVGLWKVKGHLVAGCTSDRASR
ncbi:hypothetical protein [Streptomyces yanii]|uniref:Enolase N-terminal domain-containing protein n=1 Tax=Streptomyces yanii TaxID=78510 RepID=A0ABV5QZ91_9ACTN